MMIFMVIVSCVGKKNNAENLSDMTAEENLTDAETEEIYGDSPAPEWGFDVVVEEDKPTHGEASYLHAGGFKYVGLTIKNPEGYAEYSNREDYQSLVTLFYLADYLSYDYSKSGDAYPSKKEWTDFQNEILRPLCEGAWNWEAIPVKKWKKKAGDYFYTLGNKQIMIGNRGADWQTYFYFEGEWKKQLVIRAASGDNAPGLPEGALFISTIVL